MKNKRLMLIISATVFLLACNFPLFAPSTQAPGVNENPNGSGPAPLASATSTFTPIPVPILSPTVTIVPSPSVPQVTPNSSNVNCRSGPDVAYSAISSLNVGQFAQIAGRNDDSSWWYVVDPFNPAGFCWVAASVVTTSGNLSNLPLIPPPAAIVTKVTVGASVASPVYCGGPNVIEFSGKITTNGATKVTFQWEVTGDKSNTTSPENINFKVAGTKSAPDPGVYKADCGNYTITLHVLSPNDISASYKFKVKP